MSARAATTPQHRPRSGEQQCGQGQETTARQCRNEDTRIVQHEAASGLARGQRPAGHAELRRDRKVDRGLHPRISEETCRASGDTRSRRLLGDVETCLLELLSIDADRSPGGGGYAHVVIHVLNVPDDVLSLVDLDDPSRRSHVLDHTFTHEDRLHNVVRVLEGSPKCPIDPTHRDTDVIQQAV